MTLKRFVVPQSHDLVTQRGKQEDGIEYSVVMEIILNLLIHSMVRCNLSPNPTSNKPNIQDKIRKYESIIMFQTLLSQ